LQIELSIVASAKRLTRDALRCIRVEQAGLVEIGAGVCIGHDLYMGDPDDHEKE
jgi:hypothetical protein